MSNKHRGTVNKRLIQKIDCLVEDAEYEPYKAVKRNITDEKEMFSDEVYRESEEEAELNPESSGINILTIGVVVLIVIIIGGLVYTLGRI